MILLILFAFLAGIITILSPCILPVLPVVLSSSMTGGHRRPLGVMTGFILSFSFLTLFLSTVVRLTGISPNALTYISSVVIFFFGLSLIVPRLQAISERFFSRFALSGPQNSSDGFIGGVWIGLSIGLIWAPCVGPILATVIALALSGTVTSTAVLVTISYSIGTAVPMLMIVYGGRSLIKRVPWLTKRTPKIQRAFGILMVLMAFAIFFKLDRAFQLFVLNIFPNYGTDLTRIEENKWVQDALNRLQGKAIDPNDLGQPSSSLIDKNIGIAPDLIPGGEWFNLPAGQSSLSLKELRGKVVLIDFWTYTCINCIRTLPYLRDWHAKYADQGLVIIGVHSPEFVFEKDANNVKQAIADYGLLYPVMQDNDFATWRAYSNRYWPAKYFIDREGKIRSTHFGEGEYDESEELIRKLLAETGASLDSNSVHNPSYSIDAQTPELYLGYERMEYLSSPEGVAPDQPMRFTTPNKIPKDTFAFNGEWTVGSERAMPHVSAKLELNFQAKEVFLVMKSNALGKRVRVLLDGQPVSDAQAGADVHDGVITITEDRLYRLLKLNAAGEHRLTLEFLDDGVEIYAFTFG